MLVVPFVVVGVAITIVQVAVPSIRVAIPRICRFILQPLSISLSEELYSLQTTLSLMITKADLDISWMHLSILL